jgi:predicted CopG family antitoxin
MISSNNEESTFGLDLAHAAKKTLISINSDAYTDLNAMKSSKESMLDALTEKDICLKQAQSKVGVLKSHIKNTQKMIKASQERDDVRRNEMNALEEETLQGLERAAALEKDRTSLEAKMRRSSDDHALAVAAKQCEMEAAAEQMEKHLAYMGIVVK